MRRRKGNSRRQQQESLSSSSAMFMPSVAGGWSTSWLAVKVCKTQDPWFMQLESTPRQHNSVQHCFGSGLLWMPSKPQKSRSSTLLCCQSFHSSMRISRGVCFACLAQLTPKHLDSATRSGSVGKFRQGRSRTGSVKWCPQVYVLLLVAIIDDVVAYNRQIETM